MKISKNGINFIQTFEGVRYEAYQDSIGVWTIGYGHTADVYEGMSITPEQATQYLADDLCKFEGYVDSYVTVPLTQNQFDALVSFCYNLGGGNLHKSDVLSLLNSGQYDQAADAILEWDHAGGRELPGLTRRRRAERDLFLAQ